MLTIYGIIQLIANICLIFWTGMFVVLALLMAVKEVFFSKKDEELEEPEDLYLAKLNQICGRLGIAVERENHLEENNATESEDESV